MTDPLLWLAGFGVLFGFLLFVWGLAGLMRQGAAARPLNLRAGPPLPAATVPKGAWNFPPPEQPPVLPPDMEATVKLSAVAAPPNPAAFSTPSAPAATVDTSALEKGVADLVKRVSTLEHPKAPQQAPAYLEPLLKRVGDLESEMKNLKFGFTQMAAAQNAIDMNALNAKIHGLQKLLENLTGGTEVSKPS